MIMLQFLSNLTQVQTYTSTRFEEIVMLDNITKFYQFVVIHTE